MAEHNRLDHVLPWNRGERDRFLALHGSWTGYKRKFVNKYYKRIAKEVKRWIDDINLFIFGYLVRRFWEEAVAQELKEDEIWVASFFNLNLNIVKRLKEEKKWHHPRKQNAIPHHRKQNG